MAGLDTIQAQRIRLLEQKLETLDKAMALMVQAIERLDARIGEWDQS